MKIAFVAFFLLITASLGQYANRYPVDFVYDSAPFMEYAEAQGFHRSTYDTKADVLAFAEGFLNGVGQAKMFTEIRECIADDETIINNLTTGIEDIKSKDASRVKSGIELIGQAAKAIPAAAKACKAGEDELKDLVKLVESFTSPLQFLYYVGKSLIINHVDVLNEVSNAIDAYEAKNWNQLGYWIGEAMATIILGNPEEECNVRDISADISQFAQGFLQGVETASVFQEIESCFTSTETFETDVLAAIGDIRSKDPARVKTGIELLGQAAQFIPIAAQACKAADADIENLVKLVQTFTSPESFLYYIGKSLLINHVEVINEVSQVVDSYDTSNWNQVGYWTGKAMGTIVLGQSVVVVKDTKADILSFVKGMLEGIGSAQAFAQVDACVADSEDVINDLTSAVADLETKDPAKVETGIKLIGQAAQIVPNAVQLCKAGYVDLKTLLKMVEAFQSPIQFLYYIGKSLIINHVDVITEVTSAITAFKAQNWEQFGYYCGAAMSTIVLGEDQTLTQDFADHLNQVSGWKAGIPSKFEGMTYREISSRFLGANIVDPSKFDNITVYNYEGVTDIPASFNASEQWPGCIHPIRDQGQCGSCWAFAASETLSDRLCIASNGTVNVILSPQDLLSCNNVLDHGCNGGTPLFSWWFIDSDGLVTDDCLPYASYNGTNPIKCKDFTTCADGTPLKKYYGKSPAQLANPASIQANLIQYGPVEAAMTVYQDFMYYQGGIYTHTSGSELGGHAIKITGWGNENGTNYWIVANSWGASWGENGFFRIAWGQCGIDSACIAGQADLSKSMMSENRFW